MLEDLEAAGEIDKRVDHILRAADAYGRYPTPVDDILAAAKLTQVDEYVLSDSKIAKASAYLRSLLRSAKHKVQGLVDRRERVVHVSPHIEHEAKRRFVKLHETIHDILPHQQDLVYADTNETLSLLHQEAIRARGQPGRGGVPVPAQALQERRQRSRDWRSGDLAAR